MNSVIPTPIARQPWSMLFPLIALVGFGAMVLFSAAGGSWEPYATSHVVRFLLFLVMASVMTLFGREFVRFAAYLVYGIILVLLMAVEAMGFVGGGSQRWLNLGIIHLQPSEFMKPAIVLVLAKFYSELPPGMITSWRALVPAAGLIAMPMGLVLLQPDLGTALAIGFGGATVMFLAGLPLRWFLTAGAAAVV